MSFFLDFFLFFLMPLLRRNLFSFMSFFFCSIVYSIFILLLFLLVFFLFLVILFILVFLFHFILCLLIINFLSILHFCSSFRITVPEISLVYRLSLGIFMLFVFLSDVFFPNLFHLYEHEFLTFLGTLLSFSLPKSTSFMHFFLLFQSLLQNPFSFLVLAGVIISCLLDHCLLRKSLSKITF